MVLWRKFCIQSEHKLAQAFLGNSQAGPEMADSSGQSRGMGRLGDSRFKTSIVANIPRI